MFHIVFNINENYAKYCAVVIASIIQATKYNGGGGKTIPTLSIFYQIISRKQHKINFKA